MLKIKVKGMTCGHCEATVTQAVRSVDPGAEVTVSRPDGMVTVRGSADAATLTAAVRAAGYEAAAL